MIRSLTWTYLILSALLVLIYVGYWWVYVGLDHNPGAIYCDYGGPPETHDYVKKSGDSCRIRSVIFVEAAYLSCAILLALHGPVYAYFLISHLLQRWKPSRGMRSFVVAVPILAVIVPLTYLTFVFATLWPDPEKTGDRSSSYYCAQVEGVEGDIVLSETRSCEIEWLWVLYKFSSQFSVIALVLLLPPALRPRFRAIRKTLMQT